MKPCRDGVGTGGGAACPGRTRPAELGLRRIPEQLLDTPYEGPNQGVLGSAEETWFRGFFDDL